MHPGLQIDWGTFILLHGSMCEQSKRQEQLSLTCFSFYFFSHGAEFSPQNLGQKVGKFIVFSKGCLEAGINSFLTFLKFYNLRLFILHLCKAAVQFWLNNKKTLFSQKAQTFNFSVDSTYQWRSGDATITLWTHAPANQNLEEPS